MYECVIRKLRFWKKGKKNLTLNISKNYETILLPKENFKYQKCQKVIIRSQ